MIGLDLPTWWWLIIFQILGVFVSSKLQLTRQEMCIFMTITSAWASGSYSIATVWWWWSATFGWNLGTFTVALNNPTYADLFKKFLTPYMYPTDEEIWKIAFYGTPAGELINWGPWIVPIIFWTLWMFAFAFYNEFLALLFRKQLINVERFPFPVAQPFIYTLNKGVPEEPGKFASMFNFKRLKRSEVFFYIGFVAGIIWTIPEILAYIVPIGQPFPTLYPVDLTFLAEALPGAELYMVIYNVFVVLWYLVPLDVSITAALWPFLFSILIPTIGVRLGFYPTIPGMAWGNMWARTTWQWYSQSPFKYGFFGEGVLLALAVFMIVPFWKHYRSTLLSAFGKGPKLEEEAEGISYRFIWGGIIVTFILLLAMEMAIGVPFVFALIWLLISTGVWLGRLRVVAEGPFTFQGWDTPGFSGPLAFDLAVATGALTPTVPTRSGIATMFLATSTIGGWYAAGHLPKVWYNFYEYKIADATGTSWRDLFCAHILTFLVVIPVTMILGIWQTLAYGANQLRGDYYGWWGTGTLTAVQLDYYTTHPVPPYAFGGTTVEHYILWILGFIVGGLLIFARMKYPWLIISPVGIYLGCYWSVSVLPTIVIAAILKYLTIKIGGSKGYYEVGIPIATGLIVGYGLLFGFFNIWQWFHDAWPLIAPKLLGS